MSEEILDQIWNHSKGIIFISQMNLSAVHLLCSTGSKHLNKHPNQIIFWFLYILYDTLFHCGAIISVILSKSYKGLCSSFLYHCLDNRVSFMPIIYGLNLNDLIHETDRKYIP